MVSDEHTTKKTAKSSQQMISSNIMLDGKLVVFTVIATNEPSSCFQGCYAHLKVHAAWDAMPPSAPN